MVSLSDLSVFLSIRESFFGLTLSLHERGEDHQQTMTDFIAEFAASITEERRTIRALFSQRPNDPLEERLAAAMAHHWHPWPPATPHERREAHAVDGSGAVRFFDNGTCMIVSHALLEQPNHEETATDVVFRRANVPGPVLDRYRDLLLRRLEIQIALDHVDELAGGILYLDGSLYAELPHLLYPLDIQDAQALPLRILERYLKLWQQCRELDIMLVGISKTHRGNLLGNTFLSLQAAADTIPATVSNADLSPGRESLPTDAEVLYRWAEGPGFSTPILVGMQSFGHRRRQLLNDPASLLQEYERHGIDTEWAQSLLTDLLTAPVIAACYVRFRPGEDPLRVEAPATVVTDEPWTMTDFYSRTIDPASVYPLLAYLADGYGGPSVYNAPLYTADRKVRLPRRVVDEQYLHIVRQVVGKPVNYDRSLRRFTRRS
jgi:hypothetical protein